MHIIILLSQGFFKPNYMNFTDQFVKENFFSICCPFSMKINKNNILSLFGIRKSQHSFVFSYIF